MSEVRMTEPASSPGLPLLAAAAATAVAVASGVGVGLGLPVVALMAVGAAVFAVVLVVLAYRSFESFVIAVLLVRATVDISHASAGASDRQASGGPASALALAFLLA